MLGNVFMKTLRDYRYQILGWGLGLFSLLLVQVQAYINFFQGPDREKLIENYKQTAESFSFFFGKVYDVETLGGYIHYEIMIYLPVLLGIFALLAGSGIIRGEEDKGSLDLLLTMPHSRITVILQKWAAIAVAIAAISAFGWLGLLIGVANAKGKLDTGAALLAFLNVTLVGLVFGSLALFFAQFMPSRKAAAGWVGGFLAATYMMNSIAQTFESLRWLRNFSPFYYYELSKPMAHSVGTNLWAILLLAAVPIPLLIAAVLMYFKRDHGNVFHLFNNGKVKVVNNGPTKVALPKGFWLSNTFSFGLKASLAGIFIWGLGMATYVLLIMSVFNGMRDGMLAILKTDLYRNFGFGVLPSNESLLDLLVFLFLLPLCAAYAITQIASWTSEENNGRLELMLSLPEPRWRLLVARFLVTLCALTLTVVLVGVFFVLSTQLFNVPVNAINTVGAFIGLWVVSVLILAVGFVLAAFGSGWSVAACGVLVVISFVISLLGAALKLPDWVIDLSIFHQYGKPLVNGLDWTLQIGLLGLSILFVVIGGWRFGHRDLEK